MKHFKMSAKHAFLVVTVQVLILLVHPSLQQGNSNNNGNNGNNGNNANGCNLVVHTNNGIGIGSNNTNFQGVSTAGDHTQIEFVSPIPTQSFIYECQNSSLFLGVFNVSLRAANNMNQPRNLYVNTVTCATTVPAGPAANVFDVNTYNSCDDAGSCGNCGGCNCTCRVSQPYWWNCCQDPCFGCATCCRCPTQFGWGWPANAGQSSCLQCDSDGWYSQNGQMLTPTLCQFAVQARNPANRLDYESTAPSNHTYQVRILQRTIGCQACYAQNMITIDVYVMDCNEWPVFDNTIIGSSIYQYEGSSGSHSGSTVNVLASDPDIYNTVYGSVTLTVQQVILTNVGPVNPTPWYITNPSFVGSNKNANNSILNYDASRCGSAVTSCLDLFKYSYSGATTPVFTVYVVAIDGGGLAATYSYSITVLNTPLTPSWVNMPATVSVMEGTTGTIQIYPMQAVVPNYNAAVNTVSFLIINTSPLIGSGPSAYLSAVTPCTPAAATAVRCAGLTLTSAVVGTTFSYAKQKQYNVTVWMTNKVAGSATVETISSSVIINILQRIYQPTLTPTTSSVWLNENVVGQSCFFTISGITHQNNHSISSFIYTIATPPGHVTFYLNQNTICYDDARGTNGPATAPYWIFDHSLQNQYIIPIVVNDPLSTMLAPTFTLTVNINDVEDPPVINCPTYQSIPETATAWTIALTAIKEANMSPINFALNGQSAANYNQMWYIASQTSTTASTVAAASIQTNPALVSGGQIFNNTVAPITYLNVTASTNSYTVSCQITIYILRVHQPPFFTNLPNTTAIHEKITGFVPIFTVSTGDRENDPRKVYFRDPSTGVLSSTDPSGMFTIDPSLNVIRTNVGPGSTGFNYYITPIYNLQIVVVDSPPFPNSPGSATSSFLVYLQLNQTAPTFTAPTPPGIVVTPNIKENITGQKYIYTLGSVDREGDNPYYTILDVRPTWNTAFRIPSSSNLVEYSQYYATSSPMFDYSKNPVYYIVIEVSDQKTTPTSTITLTVSIDRVDKPARWTNLPAYVSVLESVYWGPTDLTGVGAIDPNGLYPVTINYLYTLPSSGNSKFYFNTTTNTCGYVFNPDFNYGVVAGYTMVFTAFNGVQPTITGSVVIEIVRDPTPPGLNQTTHTVFIHENVTVGQTLWDLRGKDNMTHLISYALHDINPYELDKFTVTNKGIIRSNTNPNFNYTRVPVYYVRATATNTVGLITTFTLTVSIINDPEPPVITNLPSFASVREGYLGAVYGYLHKTQCYDQDGRSLSFSYNVLPNFGYPYFTINNASGLITTTSAANFNYADQPNYYVVAFCSNGFYTTSATLTVGVVWTTTQAVTTTPPWTTRADLTTETTAEAQKDVLTPGEIGAIVGALLGALLLALIAFLIARWIQRRHRKDGTTSKLKSPEHTYRSTKV